MKGKKMNCGQLGSLNSDVRFSVFDSGLFSMLPRCFVPNGHFYIQDFLYMNLRCPIVRNKLVFHRLDFIDIISGS
jgi:hypothetical protein